MTGEGVVIVQVGSFDPRTRASERNEHDLAPRVWGMDALALHDMFWVSQGVQVVRPGGAEPAPQGPRLYLLVQPAEMVLFRLDEIVERMNWLKPRAVRLRVVETSNEVYSEMVLVGDADAFRGVRRSYRPDMRRAARVALTSDAGIARQWWSAPDRMARWRTVSTRSLKGRAAALESTGRVFTGLDPSDVTGLVSELQRIWSRPEVVVPDVYEFAPGIFIHESVRVPDGARMIGPLWVGAGVHLENDAIVAGPGVVDDRAPLPTAHPARVDWHDVYTPQWPDTWQRGLRRRRAAKRAMDILFSLGVLACTLPIYPFVIGAILLEDGWPPFFAHRRQTLRGRDFGCIKFRTMLKNADHMKAQLAALNQADGPQFFIEQDPRLLRVGRFLRRTQIDELPQFINVLLGHMSVVGPRPSPDKENQYCPAWREARLSVRPGITGLWQVRRTRRPETDFQEWIRYDLEYVQRSSLRLDIWIILQTVLRLLGR